jgi:hypothetical protein
MENNQNNEQVSYEVVNDSENDNNIIILMENSNQDNESIGKKVDNDSPNEKIRKSKIKKISSPKKGNQNGDGSMSPRKSPKKDIKMKMVVLVLVKKMVQIGGSRGKMRKKI